MNQSKDILVLLLSTIAFATIGCNDSGSFTTAKEQSSYQIGYQIGRKLRAEKAEIDTIALRAGITDVLKERSFQMPESEIQDILRNRFVMEIKKASELAQANREQSVEFLKKNKIRQGVKVTSSGLQYEVLKKGLGPSPTREDMVKVVFNGTLINGSRFDGTTSEAAPVELPVQAAIAGWTEGIQLMKLGSKFRLYLPPDLAYGSKSRPGIPPHSVLIYEVELAGIRSKLNESRTAKQSPSKTPSERH